MTQLLQAPTTPSAMLPGDRPVVYAGPILRLAAFIVDIAVFVTAVTILDRNGAQGLGPALLLGYFPVSWRSAHATIGMAIFGLRLINVRQADEGFIEDPDDISYGQAAGRFVILLLGLCAAGLGVAWMIWDRRHQGWHDKAAGTAVVQQRQWTRRT